MFKKIQLLSLFWIFKLGTYSVMAQIAEKDSITIWKKIKETVAIEFSEPQKALKKYSEIYELCNAIKYHNGAFTTMIYAGIVHSNLAQYDSALVYYDKATEINRRINSKLNTAKVALNKANVYMFKTQIKKSIEEHFIGIKILENQNDSVRLSRAYANLASLYQDLDDWDKQIEFLKKSLQITPKTDTGSLGLRYCDLVLPFLQKKGFDEAFKYLTNCDSIAKISNDSYLKFFLARNTGEYYLHIEDFTKVVPHYQEAISIAENIGYNYYLNDLYIGMADALLNQERFSEATTYLKKALAFGKKEELIELEKKATFMLAILEQRRGNNKEAMSLMLKHEVLKDSLVNQQNKTIVAEANTKYLTEKKDKEIAEQKLALTESKSKTRTMGILIISLLLASILLWFVFQQRQKGIQQQLVTIQREHEVRTLETLMEGEEKERFRIAKELHDGVNGDLSAIKFKLSSLLEMNNTVIKEAVTMIDNSCEQVRAISHNLVPPSLKDFNLIEAIDEYCQSMNNIHTPKIEFQHLGDAVALDKKQEANLFRIVQELVTNSIKHSDGSEIDVQLSYLKSILQLTVEDNGKGFDPKAIKSDGIGMQNIQSRVDYLNATMDFLSNDKGTSYTIAMDLKTSTT